MKSFAVTTLFVSVALAQSGLIPAGISAGCNTYLTKLDADTTLSGCTSSIITATSAFSPNINATASTSKPSADAVKSVLANLCSSTSCPATTLRSLLADFYQACADDLITNPNKEVIGIYDTFYTLPAMKTAVCSKDEVGNYCASTIGKANPESSGVFSSISQYLYIPVKAAASALSRRADAQSVAAVQPNTTTIVTYNLLFLGLSGDLPKEQLCTTCTKNVLTSYITVEVNFPYAVGLNNSVLLPGQTPLYQSVLAKCGNDFFTKGDGVAAAAGLSGGLLGSGDEENGASRMLVSTSAGLAVGALAVLLNAAL